MEILKQGNKTSPFPGLTYYQ